MRITEMECEMLAFVFSSFCGLHCLQCNPPGPHGLFNRILEYITSVYLQIPKALGKWDKSAHDPGV